MRPRTTAFVVVFLIVAAVASWLQRQEGSPRFGEPIFTIVNGSSMTPRRLHQGDTVATALSLLATDDSGTPATQPATLVLIRRGPDGLGRELIDCDSSMHLVDPQKDQSLHNGDHLVVSPPPAPDGLQRPVGPGIPVSN